MKEKEACVFERFYQVNGTEMQPQGGSGIGLNLVKKFAELHGGKVDVTDNPSGGTIFMVDLPIADQYYLQCYGTSAVRCVQHLS